jgi:hypothetical protein
MAHRLGIVPGTRLGARAFQQGAPMGSPTRAQATPDLARLGGWEAGRGLAASCGHAGPLRSPASEGAGRRVIRPAGSFAATGSLRSPMRSPLTAPGALSRRPSSPARGGPSACPQGRALPAPLRAPPAAHQPASSKRPEAHDGPMALAARARVPLPGRRGPPCAARFAGPQPRQDVTCTAVASRAVGRGAASSTYLSPDRFRRADSSPQASAKARKPMPGTMDDRARASAVHHSCQAESPRRPEGEPAPPGERQARLHIQGPMRTPPRSPGPATTGQPSHGARVGEPAHPRRAPGRFPPQHTKAAGMSPAALTFARPTRRQLRLPPSKPERNRK